MSSTVPVFKKGDVLHLKGYKSHKIKVNIVYDLAEALDISYEKALQMIKDFDFIIGDPLEGDLQRLAREAERVRLEQEGECSEPLWMVRQQNKHFKRGRN